MSVGLQMTGLILSTAGAAWLSVFDIRERFKRSERTQEMARLKGRIDALQGSVKEVTDMITSVNRRLDEKGEAPAPAHVGKSRRSEK